MIEVRCFFGDMATYASVTSTSVRIDASDSFTQSIVQYGRILPMSFLAGAAFNKFICKKIKIDAGYSVPNLLCRNSKV